MIFHPIPLSGAYLIHPERYEDTRGFFARTFCIRELAQIGLNAKVVQVSLSFNHQKGTFRGMHYQEAPYQEDKIVSCTMGKIWDIIVDMRPESASFKQWYATELSAKNRHLLYIPKGFAHGFITLQDNSQLYYMITEFYQPEYGQGFRWDDPSFDIKLPIPIEVIHERDANYPNINF